MGKFIRNLLCGSVATLACGFAASEASATDYYTPRTVITVNRTYTQHVQYRRVVEHVTRRVAYTDYVTQYDDCGRAYQVAVTRYRTVCVPVVRYVAVHCD